MKAESNGCIDVRSNEKDFIVRTFTSKISFNQDGLETLEKLGDHLSHLRNKDYMLIVERFYDGETVTQSERRKLLADSGLQNKRYQDSIIRSNNDQLFLAKRTVKDNVKQWEKDIATYERILKNASGRKKHNLEVEISKTKRRIRLCEKKHPSVCFGGKSLMRKVTQNPEDKELFEHFHHKRMFLYFIGESNRKRGNDIVQIDPDNWDVVLRIPRSIAKLIGVSEKTVIGKINPKKGKSHIRYNLMKNVSVSYEFVWNQSKRVWRLNIITRINSRCLTRTVSSIPDRMCGIDQNAGFINATIIDGKGNPIANRRFDYEESKEIADLVQSIGIWCMHYKCSRISRENLNSLHHLSRKRNGHIAGVNKKVNRIPKGEFKRRVTAYCEVYGFEDIEVSPKDTSRLTVEWGDSKYGSTTHDKASYLIARRGIGLSLNRKKHSHTRGCVSACTKNNDILSIENHDYHDSIPDEEIFSGRSCPKG